MANEDRMDLITTFPIGVRSNQSKLGLFMIPILADFLRRRNNLELKVIINTLDSYRNRDEFVLPYTTQLKRFGISSDEVLIDRDNKNELMEAIEELAKKRYLTEQTRDKYLCSCGKLEMLTDINFNPSARFYSIEGRIPHCNLCDSNAERVKSVPLLVMTYPQDVNKGLVIPSHQEKEAVRLYKDIPEHDFLVSRSRDTGITFDGNLSKYNIDIDFLWMNYLSIIGKNRNVFVVGSNHVIWHLCLMNALYQCSQNRQNTKKSTLITPSYVIEKSDNINRFINGRYENEDPNLSRILVLSSISFNSKNSFWNEGILKYSRRKLLELDREYNSNSNLDKSVSESIKYLKRNNIERALKEGKMIGEKYDIRGWLI